MMQKFEIITIAVVLVILTGVFGFFGGRYVESQARDTEISSLQKQLQEKGSQAEAVGNKNAQLVLDYDKLVNDYNELRSKSQQYANQYPPRQPLNCISTTYGSLNQFMSTNCN